MPEYFPGTDIGSNHDLVLPAIKLKLKIKRFTKSPRIRFDLEKLKDPKIAEMFQAKVGGKFSAFCFLDSDVDTLANSLKEVLLSTAEKVLGRQRKTPGLVRLGELLLSLLLLSSVTDSLKLFFSLARLLPALYVFSCGLLLELTPKTTIINSTKTTFIIIIIINSTNQQ